MKSDVTSDMHPARAQRMRAVEEEFGEPFWDIVRGFADMGYGRSATARAIEYPESAFYALVKGRDISWPTVGEAVSRGLTPLRESHIRALSESRIKKARRYYVLGAWRRVTEISALAGVSEDAIRKRIQKGMSGDALADAPMAHVRRGTIGASIVRARRRKAT